MKGSNRRVRRTEKRCGCSGCDVLALTTQFFSIIVDTTLLHHGIQVMKMTTQSMSMQQSSRCREQHQKQQRVMLRMDIDDNNEDIVEEVDDAKENMGPCVRLDGDSIDLVLGAPTLLVLGTNVGASKNQAKLTLASQKRMLSVHVKDLANSLSINGNKIRTEGKLFLGDKLSVGDLCTLTVAKASDEMRTTKAANKKTVTTPDCKKAATRLAPAKATQGFLLSFTQGPYKGETIELTKSDVLGPKTARGAKAFSLQKDTDATGTVKLDLLVLKKYCAVQVGKR